MLATWITQQVVFDGLVQGFVYGLLAMSIVLIYRSTKVINFAVGNMGLVGAGLLVILRRQLRRPVLDRRWPSPWSSAPLYGALIELVVIRRLFKAPRVIVLVATIGVAQLSLADPDRLPEPARHRARRSPRRSGRPGPSASVQLKGPELLDPDRGAAHRHRARLVPQPHAARAGRCGPRPATPTWPGSSGISPRMRSTLRLGARRLRGHRLDDPHRRARGLGGQLPGPRPEHAAAGPHRRGDRPAHARSAPPCSPALVDRASVEAHHPVQLPRPARPGRRAAARRRRWSRCGSSRASGGEGESAFSFTPPVEAIPARLKAKFWVRHLDRGRAARPAWPSAVALPLVVTQPSRLLLYATIAAFAICALSLTVLTGWAGQLSLGQMAFAGIGALTAAALTRGPRPSTG